MAARVRKAVHSQLRARETCPEDAVSPTYLTPRRHPGRRRRIPALTGESGQEHHEMRRVLLCVGLRGVHGRVDPDHHSVPVKPKQSVFAVHPERPCKLRTVVILGRTRRHSIGSQSPIDGSKHTHIPLYVQENCRERGWRGVSNSKLVYDILPSTTAVFSYAIGSRKLSANEQLFFWCSNSSN